MLIAIEGVDAAGKATQARLLKESVERTGLTAVLYSFPRYETPTGKIIRKILTNSLSGSDLSRLDDMYVAQSMMWADKMDAMPQMLDDLGRKRVVICDRYSMSSIAYGLAEGLPLTWLQNINMRLLKPDVQILLDVDPVKAAERRSGARDRNEGDFVKLNAVRDIYLARWRTGYPDSNWLRLDASLPPDELNKRIVERVNSVGRSL